MMTSRVVRAIALVVLVSLLGGCGARRAAREARTTPVAAATEVYALVNLHPDTKHARLYTTNYIQRGLIAAGTRVDLLEKGAKTARFRVKGESKVYTIQWIEKTTSGTLSEYVDKVFGAESPAAKIAALSEVDRRGIVERKALPGMTREGVVFALGYPPVHATPTLSAPAWTYWVNRYSRMRVAFDASGHVLSVAE